VPQGLLARHESSCQRVCQNLSGVSTPKTQHKFKAPLGDVAEPTRPFEILAIDVLGPFPLTPDKNRYLLTFMDHLTRYPEAVPVSDTSAPTVARAYVTAIVARHGASTKLLSDRGTNFTSAFFRETCKILG
jgi:transposase InsO family protein